MREQLKERLDNELNFMAKWLVDLDEKIKNHLDATGESLNIDQALERGWILGKRDLIRELQRDFIEKRCTCHE